MIEKTDSIGRSTDLLLSIALIELNIFAVII